MLAAGTATAQTTDQAARAVQLFADTCLRWPGDTGAVTAFMHGRHALPLVEHAREMMMPGSGEAFDATDDVARLALLTDKGGRCRVVGYRGMRDVTTQLLDDAVTQSDPNHAAPLDTTGPTGSATRSYVIARDGVGYSILAWTTDAAAPYQIEITMDPGSGDPR